MNLVKLVNKLGFDVKSISNPDTRREYVSLLEIFFKGYNITGKVMPKTVFIEDGKTYKYEFDKSNFKAAMKDIVDRKANLQLLEDDNKTAKCIEAFVGDKFFDVVMKYDKKKNVYELTLKPTIKESFGHHDYAGCFMIRYDANADSIFATRAGLCKNTSIFHVTNRGFEETYYYNVKASSFNCLFDKNAHSKMFTNIKMYDEDGTIFSKAIVVSKSISNYGSVYLTTDVYDGITSVREKKDFAIANFNSKKSKAVMPVAVHVNQLANDFYQLDRVEYNHLYSEKQKSL